MFVSLAESAKFINYICLFVSSLFVTMFPKKEVCLLLKELKLNVDFGKSRGGKHTPILLAIEDVFHKLRSLSCHLAETLVIFKSVQQYICTLLHTQPTTLPFQDSHQSKTHQPCWHISFSGLMNALKKTCTDWCKGADIIHMIWIMNSKSLLTNPDLCQLNQDLSAESFLVITNYYR